MPLPKRSMPMRKRLKLQGSLSISLDRYGARAVQIAVQCKENLTRVLDGLI